MKSLVVTGLAALSMAAGAGEVLYNGIRLPDEWPPRTDAFAVKGEPARPFYLEEKNVPDPIPVDVGRQLFVDDFLVAEMKGLRREYPHPEKFAGNPVLKPETWLEKNGTRNATARPNGGGLWWDPHLGQFRLWYEAGWLNAIAYATSSNGVDFVRPNIHDGTNQIYPADERPDSWEVVPDYAAADPYSRWCLFLSGPGGDEPSMLMVSRDGKSFYDRVLTGRCGDRSNFFYNPFRGKWVYSVRAWSGKGGAGRVASYREVEGFPGKCDWKWNFKTPGESEDLVAWARADEQDGIDPEFKCPAQLYALSAVAYESIILGAFEIHRGPDNLAAAKTGNPKITDIVFAYSRDGFHWTRPDRTPAIPASRWGSGKWDAGYVQPLGNLFVITDEQLRFYYGAFAGDTNKTSLVGHNSPENGMYDNGAMGFASLRRDGFAALTGDGELTTRRLSFTKGDRLFVNADCSQGEIDVEVVGGARKTLKGVDATKIEVMAAASGTVQLKFVLRGGAKLYSFWFSDKSGCSRGYLGGGGPDYPGLRDCPQPQIVVDDRLPAGCLKRAVVEGDAVHLTRDYRDTEGGWFYWKFRVTGAAGKTLTFDFPGVGWAVGSRGAAVSCDRGKTWRWSSETEHESKNSFTWTFAEGPDEVWFAQTIPYLPEDWEAFLSAHAADRGKLFETAELCKTKKGRSVPYARFGVLDGSAKVKMFVAARHHCQEASASPVVEGMAASFFADDELGRWLRANVELRVVPFVDYDGVVDGDQGKNRRPHDHCRDYNEGRAQVHPEVAAIMKMLKAWRPTVVQDTHSPWLRDGGSPDDTNGFAYQVGNPSNRFEMAAFGDILARVQKSGFGYRAADDVPFGRCWNAGANYKQGQTLNIWAQFDLKTCRYVTTFEIPFANQHEKTIYPSDQRGFGRDLMLAYREYLQQESR